PHRQAVREGYRWGPIAPDAHLQGRAVEWGYRVEPVVQAVAGQGSAEQEPSSDEPAPPLLRAEPSHEGVAQRLCRGMPLTGRVVQGTQTLATKPTWDTWAVQFAVVETGTPRPAVDFLAGLARVER